MAVVMSCSATPEPKRFAMHLAFHRIYSLRDALLCTEQMTEYDDLIHHNQAKWRPSICGVHPR